MITTLCNSDPQRTKFSDFPAGVQVKQKLFIAAAIVIIHHYGIYRTRKITLETQFAQEIV